MFQGKGHLTVVEEVTHKNCVIVKSTQDVYHVTQSQFINVNVLQNLI